MPLRGCDCRRQQHVVKDEEEQVDEDEPSQTPGQARIQAGSWPQRDTRGRPNHRHIARGDRDQGPGLGSRDIHGCDCQGSKRALADRRHDF